ncbi:MAG TPA: hypothetical protein VN181_01315 [Thermoanaerobaculia bacterium]|nr:hypothetical protein [Thermoanaerobaculia bacterium]
MAEERRTFQRLRLAKPILATMNGENALILDIGLTGALVEHYGDATPGNKFPLSFRWKGHDVELVAEIARTTIVVHPGGDHKAVMSHTGVHFVDAVGDARAHVQDLMATFVTRVIDAQKANAAGDTHDASATILSELGGARRARSHGYVTCLLKEGKWWRMPVASPKQPAGDGFTVAAHEDEEELDMLCRTYETLDAEGRRLIRLVAELSVAV